MYNNNWLGFCNQQQRQKNWFSFIEIPKKWLPTVELIQILILCWVAKMKAKLAGNDAFERVENNGKFLLPSNQKGF